MDSDLVPVFVKAEEIRGAMGECLASSADLASWKSNSSSIQPRSRADWKMLEGTDLDSVVRRRYPAVSLQG